MTEIYKISNRAFLKNISLGIFLLLLWVFWLSQVSSDSGSIYYWIILTAFGLLIIYLSIAYKKKKLLEISVKGIVINEKIRLIWESIQSFNLRMVRIKNKELAMIDVIMKENWDSSHLSRRFVNLAHINSKSRFWEFLIPVNQLSIDEIDILNRLETLLTLDEDNREQYLSHNKYR